MKSLNDWTVTRQEIIDFVNVLSEKELSFSGTHSEVGKITVLDVLQMMLDHDKEHLQALHHLISDHKIK